MQFYSDPASRGYLANPDQVAEQKQVLAQKYGYEYKEPTEKHMLATKDPRQIFYGLSPGWVVNLADKCIYKPTDPHLEEFYKS